MSDDPRTGSRLAIAWLLAALALMFAFGIAGTIAGILAGARAEDKKRDEIARKLRDRMQP